MIQELLGGVVEDRKISIPSFATTNSSISSPSQSAASSPSSSSADAQQQQQNLRCPRCDSSNTKFCYYNNYNLTQPRHFCKTCRRYWTKGGALRNVPIGGGCRKTKPAAPSIVASNGKSGGSNCKTKPMASLDVMGRVVGLGGGGGLDHHHGGGQELLPSSPILWATSMPHSSHLLALLRASQMQQNHNPNPTHNHITPSLLNSIRIKDEGLVLGGAQVMAEPNCGLNAHSLGLDHLGQLPIGSCSSSLWKNENQFHYQQQVPQQQNLLLSEGPTSSGIQELYQRLSRSSSTSNNYCNSDHLQVIANNVTGCYSSAAATTTMASTTTASIMEPIPLAGGDFGYWNPAMSWPDLSTTNGAFP